MKEFQRAMARYGMFMSFAIYKCLPFGVVKFFSNALIGFAYLFVSRHKKIAKESLEIAFSGKKSEEEIRQITHKCFHTFGYGMIEMLYSMAHPETVKKKVKIEGKKYLDAALAQGKGVVAVTAHFGNFPLMMMALGQKGYAVSSIIRPVRDAKMEKFLVKKRKECFLNTVYAVPRRKCVSESIKVLRENGVLFIPLDQNFGNGKGVFVEFFGQKAATATGPVVFAERTGAVILPMFIVRTGEDEHKIIIEPPVEIEKGEDEQGTLFVNISKITQIIEAYIRKYPHEWGWFHKRWKSRPNGNEVISNE